MAWQSLIYQCKFPVSDVIMQTFMLLNLELEVEAETLPLVMWQKLNLIVKNDIKPVVMAFLVTTYKLKQTDFSHNILVDRFPPN